MSTTSDSALELPEVPPMPAFPEEPDEPWREKYAREWLQTKLAYEGFMLDKIMKQQDRVFKVADGAVTGKFDGMSEDTDEPGQAPDGAPAEGDKMGANIGNVHKEYHYHVDAPKTTDNSELTTIKQSIDAMQDKLSPTRPGVPTWAKVAAVAALVSPLASSAVTAWWIKGNTPAPAVVQPAEDTDTNAGLRIKKDRL